MTFQKGGDPAEFQKRGARGKCLIYLTLDPSLHASDLVLLHPHQVLCVQVFERDCYAVKRYFSKSIVGE